ncbi:hypothetical protein J2W40_001759 [Sphingobium xenophagum]|uniref:Uncharacterized protein n=2 Tax=Sphingobium xenophagum TaxID=121428 RepID=A0ABU1X047_SPHXE|nr:hypothetical protein [Sphingobium xenophagum]
MPARAGAYVIFSSLPDFAITCLIMDNSDKGAPQDGADDAPAAGLPDDEPTTLDMVNAVSRSISKTAWTGAAVGIGSAAIVAALLYTRKRS